MKVKELYDMMEKGKELWSFSVWSEDGMEQLGLANSFYSFDDIAENIKNAEVENFKVGYNSLFIRIDTVKTAFYGQYSSEWDFVHKNLEKGLLYDYFLSDNNMEDDSRINFSDIPTEYQEQYKKYIMEYMKENLDYTDADFEDGTFLESVLEQFKKNL